MKFIKYFLFLSVISLLFLPACKKDSLLTDSSAKLDFSTDSILFDTVFTTLGSTTQSFRIYNRHNQPLNISKVYLATGPNSNFKLNVDGVSGKSISDIEIAGGDSLFVFVQVTVDPNGGNSPLLIRDSIIFETNGNTQDVKLTAVGQDAYIHKPDHFPTNGLPPYSIIPCVGGNATWTNDKPHLIFGYAVVDSACILTMDPGTRVYLYNKSVLWVYKDGTLKVNGLKGNEVTFQGMRLEQYYKEIPGQWGKIWLSKGSKNNEINWGIIKNGSIGIQVDSAATPGIPTLKLTNTIVKNMHAAALFAQGGFINSNNCVFANCGQYVAALTIGGSYSFEHCTFANFWNIDQRTTPLLLLNNYYQSVSGIIVRPVVNCDFTNCILYGDQDEEIGLDSLAAAGSGLLAYNFDHCIIKTLRSTPAFHYNTPYKNVNPGFKNVSINNYELGTNSNSINKGTSSISPASSFDLNNHSRPNTSTDLPDLGAYEFY